MLKFQLDTLEGVEESLQALYEQKGDKYQLKVDGAPSGNEDVAGLKRKVDELLQEKKDAAKRAKEAEEAASRAAEEAARKSGDVAALEKSWQEKLAKREAELLASQESLNAQVRNLTVGRAAADLAAELAVQGSAKALLPHIQSRITMDIRDGQPVAVVLDANGKPSAATLDELKNEFINDPAFAPLIVASKATGGGANGGNGGGAAGKGDMGGDKAARVSAIAAKFPELTR